jgi:ABC-type branched-subunit amino acid transport system ATPase component/ABC-type branched-subunit amino acid transport system permease subunit
MMTTRSPASTRALAIRILRYATLAFLVVWPWYKATFVFMGDADVTLVYVIVTVSLVLLTGWVGQISLAQAGFVGVSAFVTAMVAGSLHLGFPLSTIVSALAAAGAAAAMGFVALRVRGLYLAVATLIFSWLCDSYLFVSRWFTRGGGSVSVKNVTVGVQGTFPYFDLTNRRTFYYVGLAVAAIVLFAMSNLRDSRTGRALFAVKGSEVAAASLGVNVTRYKLLAFSLSGLIAGLAGNLIALYQGSLTPDQFKFTTSFFYLAVVVVGGLQSLWGGVAAAMLFGALNGFFYRVPALNGYPEVVSAVLLVVVLLAYPGGMAAVPDTARKVAARFRARAQRLAESEAEGSDGTGKAPVSSPIPPWAITGFPILGRLLRWALQGMRALGGRVRRNSAPVGGRLLPLDLLGIDEFEVDGAAPTENPPAADETIDLTTPSEPVARVPRDPSNRGPALLQADEITVRFGGLVAVDNVSLAVHEGEIVGLIGPNGAGKTTLFNAIAGLNRPSAGTVKMFDVDATDMPVHMRACLGVGRTFQAIQLLTDLTVFDNLLVATHLQNDTGFLSHMAVTRRALLAEHSCRQLVHRIIELLDLGDVAYRKVAGLPFGTLRMVEIARALATRSPLIMLDEPASGLDNTETDRLAELLFYLRDSLGVSILLIEHDVQLVTSVCDHMYVIDRGKPIASGPTADVQRDPRVIAAYLGVAPESESEGEVEETNTPLALDAPEPAGVGQ